MPFCCPTSCLARSALRSLMRLWLSKKIVSECIFDGPEHRAASGTLPSPYLIGNAVETGPVEFKGLVMDSLVSSKVI